jgi:hypothetical protein
MMRATLQDLATLKRSGYSAEKYGDIGWLLLGPEGESLQIAGFGGVCPHQWQAVAEGLARITLDTNR